MLSSHFVRYSFVASSLSFPGGIFNRSYLLADDKINQDSCPINNTMSDIYNNNNNSHAINYNNITKTGEFLIIRF